MPKPIRTLAWLLLLTCMGACSRNASVGSTPDSSIDDVLNSQLVAWNKGDLEGFMQGYWKSDELVFVSPTGMTKGWQETLNRYKHRYPTKEKMGHLQFTDLKIQMNSPSSATVTGR